MPSEIGRRPGTFELTIPIYRDRFQPMCHRLPDVFVGLSPKTRCARVYNSRSRGQSGRRNGLAARSSVENRTISSPTAVELSFELNPFSRSAEQAPSENASDSMLSHREISDIYPQELTSAQEDQLRQIGRSVTLPRDFGDIFMGYQIQPEPANRGNS